MSEKINKFGEYGHNVKEDKPVIHKNINENADSLEIGSASKGGKVKVYGTYDDVSAFKKKLDNAKTVRDYANANICVNV